MGTTFDAPCVSSPKSKPKQSEISKNEILLSYDRYKELKQAEIENANLKQILIQQNLSINDSIPSTESSPQFSSQINSMNSRLSISNDIIFDTQPRLNSAFRVKSERPYKLTKKTSQIIKSEDLDIVIELEFDGKCLSISSCVAIKRIIKILRWYSFCGDDHDKLLITVKDNKYDECMLNDYHHILNYHLNNKQIKDIKYEFDMIYNEINEISKHVKPCKLHECAGFIRHHRQRETNSNTNSNESELQFYIDTMDSIHCYFMHSYDTAMRHKIDEMDQKYDDIKNNDDADGQNDEKEAKCMDDKMKKMKEKLKRKWEDLNNIVAKNSDNGNKYFTKVASTISDSAQYCFGHRFYYWSVFKDNTERDYGPNHGYKKCEWYIGKKYRNLKAELSLNKIFKLSWTGWHNANKKADKSVICDFAKQSLSDNSPMSEYCKIKPGTSIDTEHILAVILYCDYSELSFHFGTTFRYNHDQYPEYEDDENLDQQLKQRNSEYWHWSKLLQETVDLYGTNMSSSGIKIFYHGISFMTFSNFLAYFCAPTSTTTMMEVAVNFAKDDGIIIEIEKENNYSPCKYFDCSWLSTFGNEDERLFFGDDKPVKFHSIHNMKTNEDYYYFIHALTLFHYVLEGKALTKEDKVKAKDYVIISELMMQYDKRRKYKNDKIPLYVDQLFKAFVEERTHIKINLNTMNTDYPGFETYLLSSETKKLILFDDLSVIFPCCEQISIWGVGNMSSLYIDKLKNMLENMYKNTDHHQDKLQIIELYDVKWNYKQLNKKFMEKYQTKFSLSAYCDISLKPINHSFTDIHHPNNGKDATSQNPMQGSLLYIKRRTKGTGHTISCSDTITTMSRDINDDII